MEGHLGSSGGPQQFSEPGQSREVRRAGGGERQEAAIFDQEAIVLADPVFEACPLQCSVADTANERMRVLSGPDLVGGLSQAIRETRGHCAATAMSQNSRSRRAIRTQAASAAGESVAWISRPAT